MYYDYVSMTWYKSIRYDIVTLINMSPFIAFAIAKGWTDKIGFATLAVQTVAFARAFDIDSRICPTKFMGRRDQLLFLVLAVQIPARCTSMKARDIWVSCKSPFRAFRWRLWSVQEDGKNDCCLIWQNQPSDLLSTGHFFRQKSSSLASMMEVRGRVLSYKTTIILSIFLNRSESSSKGSKGWPARHSKYLLLVNQGCSQGGFGGLRRTPLLS